MRLYPYKIPELLKLCNTGQEFKIGGERKNEIIYKI